MDDIIQRALSEDIGAGDITVEAVIPAGVFGTAAIVAKEPGILAGVAAAAGTFIAADADLDVKVLAEDGAELQSGTRIMEIRGAAGSLLKAERTALNFLQHLSGIATTARRYVRAVAGTGAVILDTRKTTPGLRRLEKAAVAAGGGANHRMGLYDMVLIKNNHLAALGCAGEPEAVERAVARARAAVRGGMPIEVEVRTAAGALAAVRAGADMILLDNMTPEEMAASVRQVRAAAAGAAPLLEASGGITLDNVRAAAAAGVDRISVGALTHSAAALDIAMYLSFH